MNIILSFQIYCQVFDARDLFFFFFPLNKIENIKCYLRNLANRWLQYIFFFFKNIKLGTLQCLARNLFLKFKWIKTKPIFSHKCTLKKALLFMHLHRTIFQCFMYYLVFSTFELVNLIKELAFIFLFVPTIQPVGKCIEIQSNIK